MISKLIFTSAALSLALLVAGPNSSQAADKKPTGISKISPYEVSAQRRYNSRRYYRHGRYYRGGHRNYWRYRYARPYRYYGPRYGWAYPYPYYGPYAYRYYRPGVDVHVGPFGFGVW
jgi:hypothetical protein